MPRGKKWTRETIIEKLVDLHQANEPLTISCMQKLGLGGLVAAAYKEKGLGSWRNTLHAAGIGQAHLPPRKRAWTPEKVKERIRELYRAGEDLSHRKARAHHQYLVVIAVRLFGSWEKAVTVAGLDYNAIRKLQEWNRDKILKEIRHLHDGGEPLSYGAVLAHHSTLAAAACNPRYFGSWKAAVNAAGIEYRKVRKHREPWTKEAIVEVIKELHQRGESLTSTNVRNNLGYRTMEYAARHTSNFGSWRAAVRAAGLELGGPAQKVARPDKPEAPPGRASLRTGRREP